MSKPASKSPNRRPRPIDPPPFPKVWESYSVPYLGVPRNEPSAVNGISIRRYRVTIDLIDEPVEVLRDRLRKLWRDTPRNGHLTSRFDECARQLGIELDLDERAVDAKERE